MPTTQHKVCFVGVGSTMPTLRVEKPDLALATAAIRAAAEDAGLRLDEVDGLSLQTHHSPHPAVPELAQALGFRDLRWQRDGVGDLGMLPAGIAAQALDAGLCTAVAVSKVMNLTQPPHLVRMSPADGRVSGPAQFDTPYCMSYYSPIALFMQRYVHRYGVTPEQLAWVPIVQREHALLNPRAIRKTPLTMGDYVASPFLSEPIRELDCATFINGAMAYIMTREERAKTLRHKPVYFTGWAESGATLPHYLQAEILEGLSPVAKNIYKDTGLSPKDMDLWFMYDGYGPIVLLWLENLGLVPRGEAASYVEGGERIRYTGEHPLNTNGGNLSEGRWFGAGHIQEAIHQLRGTAGPRQAKRADYAILPSTLPGSGPVGIMGRG